MKKNLFNFLIFLSLIITSLSTRAFASSRSADAPALPGATVSTAGSGASVSAPAAQAVLPISSAPFALQAQFALAPSTNVYATKPYSLVVTLTSTHTLQISRASVPFSDEFMVQNIQVFSQTSNAFAAQIQIDFVPLAAGVVNFAPIRFLVRSEQAAADEEPLALQCPVPPMLVLPSEKSIDPRSFRDIKDPVGPKPLDWLWLTLIALLGAAALATGIYFYREKKQRAAAVPSAEPARPAHEVALEKMQAGWRRYERERELKRFYFELSAIFREYLSKEFHVDALEKTTQEIFAALRAKGVDRAVCLECKDLLASCDLVKFANFVFSENETEKTFLAVRDFIRRRAENSDRAGQAGASQ